MLLDNFSPEIRDSQKQKIPENIIKQEAKSKRKCRLVYSSIGDQLDALNAEETQLPVVTFKRGRCSNC